MNIDSAKLILSGYAYLNAVEEQKDSFTAHLSKLLSLSSVEDKQEEVALNCIVSDTRLKRLLLGYQHHLAKQSAVLVSFTAQYDGTLAFQHCVTESDPEHIVTMKIKLLHVHEFFIDGVQHYPINDRKTANLRYG